MIALARVVMRSPEAQRGDNEHQASEHERSDEASPKSIVVVLTRQDDARPVTAIGTVLVHESFERHPPAEKKASGYPDRSDSGDLRSGRHLDRSVGRAVRRQPGVEETP